MANRIERVLRTAGRGLTYVGLTRSALRVGAALAVSGCSIAFPGSHGATHHVIVGLGVVTTNDTQPTAAVVTRAQSLGIMVTDRPGMKIGVGYSSSMVTTVADGARDVRIEAAQYPGGPLIVDVPSAVLEGAATASATGSSPARCNSPSPSAGDHPNGGTDCDESIQRRTVP